MPKDAKPKDAPKHAEMDAIQRAAAFAAPAHEHHRRKDKTTPYIAHPFRVTMTLRHAFKCKDESALVAAVLHDTIEDSPVDYDDILEQFGREVADLVSALTKNMLLEESERELDYDRRLARADWRARLIKLADCYDNLSELQDRSGKGMKKMLEKCRRAIRLARLDESDHRETRIGIGMLEALMKRSAPVDVDAPVAVVVAHNGKAGAAGAHRKPVSG